MKFIRPTPISVEGSFTRSTTATYFDVAGVMQTAAIDVPRIGYDPVTHAHTGLIIEAAATNLLIYSEHFSDGWWTKVNSTISPNATTAPDGSVTADAWVEATGSSQKYLRTPLATTGPATYTMSCYAKKIAGTRYLVMEFDAGGGEVRRAFFDLTGGTVTTNYNGAVGTIASVGGGWYRCATTVTMVGAASATYWYISNSGSSVAGYTGDGTSGIYVWGAQLETGSTATSYVKTVAAAVTRAADVVTGTGLIYSNIPENDYAAWNAATSYTLADRVIRTTTHRVYEKVSAGALVSATLPELDTTNWIEVSPTNKWGALDQQVWSESSAADKIVMILKPGRFNSIALLQVDAANVTVDLNVSGNTVYAASMNLTLGSNVGDWYQYFYEPVYQQDNLVITDLVDAALLDLPAYGEGILTVTISRAATTVSCGVLVVGLYANLGSTQYSPTIGIIDYSRKETDTFGNSIIVPRRYSKRMTAEVMVMQNAVDNVARLLAQYRTTPLVWVGSDDLYTSMIIYGFYKDWEINIANPIQSNLSLQVEGLT